MIVSKYRNPPYKTPVSPHRASMPASPSLSPSAQHSPIAVPRRTSSDPQATFNYSMSPSKRKHDELEAISNEPAVPAAAGAVSGALPEAASLNPLSIPPNPQIAPLADEPLPSKGAESPRSKVAERLRGLVLSHPHPVCAGPDRGEGGEKNGRAKFSLTTRSFPSPGNDARHDGGEPEGRATSPSPSSRPRAPLRVTASPARDSDAESLSSSLSSHSSSLRFPNPSSPTPRTPPRSKRRFSSPPPPSDSDSEPISLFSSVDDFKDGTGFACSDSAVSFISALSPSTHPPSAYQFSWTAGTGHGMMRRAETPASGSPKSGDSQTGEVGGNISSHGGTTTPHGNLSASADDEDDGEGLNGLGFRPTPAAAYARSQRRKQQLSDWRAREAREARLRRFERRRMGTGNNGTSAAIGTGDAKFGAGVKKRVVRFAGVT